MKIHFLGTNGWFDSKTGNTICTLIDTKDCYIILDAGFGIVKAKKIIKEDKPVYLFLSHLHLDHICGLHALPFLDLKQGLKIFVPKGAKKELQKIYRHPYAGSFKEIGFKVTIDEVEEKKYNKPVNFSSKKLHHIDTNFGYRFILENKVIVYSGDTSLCKNSFVLAKEADLLIHECAISPGEEMEGWGHTNPEGSADLAVRSKAKKLILTHFGASSYKTINLRKEAEAVAKKIFKNTIAAKDGMVVEI